MKDYLFGKVLMAQMKMRDAVEKFVQNEEGDTNFVSIIIIIVIVLAIAAIFRDKLKALVEDVFVNLTDFVNNTKPN